MEKRKAERRWRKSGLHVDKDMYKLSKHISKQVCDKAKREYFRNRLSDVSNCKQLFQTTNEILGKISTPSLPTQIDEKELPNAFLAYFENKVKDIRKNFTDNPNQKDCNNMTVFEMMNEFKIVSEEEVRNIIMKSPS